MAANGNTARANQISSDEWPIAYAINIDPSSECYLESRITSMITWPFNETVTVQFEIYAHEQQATGAATGDDDGAIEECVPSGYKDFYPKDRVMYTSSTPWPYNVDSVCSYFYRVMNDHNFRNSTVYFYSQLSDDLVPTDGDSHGARPTLALFLVGLAGLIQTISWL